MPQQERVNDAMTREWDKWNEFGVTKVFVHEAKPKSEDRGDQMGSSRASKTARLVVEKCQEDKGYIKTDAPTGSRDAFFMTLSAASPSGWDYSVFDAQSAYLQSDGIKRLLLLRMPHKNPPPGTKPGQVFVATGSIHGTRDAGRGVVTSTSRKCLRQLVLWSQTWKLSVCVQESLQEIQGCFGTSCAQASFETTVRLGCLLRKDHLQRWQSH